MSIIDHRRKTIRGSVVLISVFFHIFLSLPAYASLPWEHSIDKALSKSTHLRKPVIVDFSTTWCGWCRRMEQETFASGSVTDMARDFIWVKIDGDSAKDTVRKYGVRGYPTVLFLNDQGKVIRRINGFVTAPTFANAMKAVKRSYRPSKRTNFGSAGSKGTGEEGSGFVLGGLLYTPSNPKAIINGELVAEGARIGGAKVISITADKVTLEDDEGRRVMLHLEDNF